MNRDIACPVWGSLEESATKPRCLIPCRQVLLERLFLYLPAPLSLTHLRTAPYIEPVLWAAPYIEPALDAIRSLPRISSRGFRFAVATVRPALPSASATAMTPCQLVRLYAVRTQVGGGNT